MNKETSNETKQIDVFLALPCAEVFTEVKDCIKGAFVAANTNPIVIEDLKGLGLVCRMNLSGTSE